MWTGRELLIWGGWNGDDEARNYALSGRRYDPVADVWRPMSAVGAPQPREDAAAVWTGTELIVWGGVVRDGDPAQRHRLGTGGRYDPVTDTWQPVTLTNAPTPREDAVVVWTGDEMLVWGGRGDDFVPRLGARYVPAADRWCPMASRNAPTAGHDAAGVWTGRQLLVWGGDAALGTGGAYLTGGGAYQPPAASDPAE